MKIITAILCGLLFMSLSTFAETKQPIKSPEKSAPAPLIPLAALDASTDLKLQQQKLDFFKERLDQQDKRIGDLNFSLTFFGVLVSVIGALMAVVMVYFSIRSKNEAVLEAKNEARKEVEIQSKEIISTWLGKDGQQLLVQKIEATLRPEIDKALSDIRNETDGVIKGLEEEKRKARDHNAKHEQLNEQQEKKLGELDTRSDEKDKPLSLEQKKSVDEAAKKLEAKPPEKYSFEDWFTLGNQAYASSKYEIAADHLNKAIGIATSSTDQIKALFKMGLTLDRMDKSDEAIAVYDEIVHRFGDAKELALRVLVARAMINKGIRLGKLERSADEISVYEEVVRRHGDSAELALRERVITALLFKGIALGQMGRDEEAIAIYDEMVRRFGDAKEPVLRVQVARALINRGFRNGKLGRDEEEIAAYDEVMHRFDNSVEPALLEQVARALIYKGFRLGKLDRHEEAIATFDEVVQRFGDSVEPLLREQVARAMIRKGFSFIELGRNEEAIALHDEVMRRFGDSEEAALKEQVAISMNSIGFHLLCNAKKIWKDGDVHASLTMLEQAFVKIEAALKFKPDNPIYLGNKGYILFLMGKVDEATIILKRAITLGGEDLRNGEIADAEIHPLPQDGLFKALIRSL